ncbi:murein hydrolase activator EnvC family protein [Aestuariivirga sp.]|jgi:septal ring factor EnvC (AmiA/AmiB activator)|uniref:murein hydrolase activator EnvC family protein n=1 Tax=Aestuariivirga sp. TaxID=2650926 RepID=UPI003783E211
MRRFIVITALPLLGLAAACQPARAQETQQLETLEQQIQGSKAAEARIAGDIAAAIAAEDEIARKLAAVAAEVQAQEAAVGDSEADVETLQRERTTVLAELGETQDVLSELLAGLQQLEQNPPPALVVKPDDILAALRGAMLLGTIAPELQAEAQALNARLDRLTQLEADIARRRKEVAQAIVRLDGKRTDLALLVEQKRALVNAGNAALAAERERTAALARKAKSLRQLLARLAEEQQKTAAATSATEKERERQEELLRQPEIAFADARGRLPLPARGEVLRQFGDPDGLGREMQGVMIATLPGAQVTAPASGKVEFAGPFRSYGQMVILNPGGGYRVLLAGMDRLTAAVGDYLRAGEPVGEMGFGPASVTLFGEVATDGRPVLYIEFRSGTDAIDSGPWWAGGMKEARG